MKAEVREYKQMDRPSIVKCMEELQDYLINVDQLKFTRRMPEYGERFTRKLLEDVGKNNGIIYVAEDEDLIVGFIAGIVFEWPAETLFECVPLKSGRILELFVKTEY